MILNILSITTSTMYFLILLSCWVYVRFEASVSMANFATLKMKAISSSETSVNTRPTQRHVPEDDILVGFSSLLNIHLLIS
jgi:hypothetical protein